jgi:hypothetical protein
MTVEEPDAIDFLAAKPGGNRIELVISDHLGWSEDEEDSHIQALQRKIYRYLDFIQGGELAARHQTEGKRIVIRIVAEREPSRRAAEFLGFVRNVASEAGVEVEFAHLGSA